VPFQQFIEGLESRQFLSATIVFNAPVAADRLVVRADLLHFQSDILANDAKLLIDVHNIKANVAKGDTSLKAPFAKLRADVNTTRIKLKEDRLTEAANALADESVIKLDYVKVLKDKGNAAAEAADHTALRNARIKLQNDLVAGLDARIATRQANEATIAADTQAIVDAANKDPGATMTLKDAAATFAGDRVTCLNTLTADLQAIESARSTLVDALTAAQSAK
jgi:hypothetical protein